MSTYATLRPFLRAVSAHGRLDAAAVSSLHSMANPATTRSSTHPAWRQAAQELDLALDLVKAVAEQRLEDALQVAATLAEVPLRPSPFETLLEEAGVKLAAGAGDDELLLALTARRDAYWQRYAAGATLVGATALLSEPELGELLAQALDPGESLTVTFAHSASDAQPASALESLGTSDHGSPGPLRPRDPPLHMQAQPTSAFTPFAAEDEQHTNAYVVALHHLQEARTATFAVHRVVWHDLESDDPRVSDLVLAFEDDAGAMLRSVDPELLSLRLLFGDGPAYDEVSTRDRSLFDVEINPAEGRIYLKLRRPAAWSATDLPPAELWSKLRSCVLITEPG